MTRWHHGASTLLRHAVAALPFRGSHCRTRKNTRHGWRDRPQQGDRQQRECSGSSHPHKCTTFSGCDEQVLASKNDVSLTRTTAAVTGITASKLSFKDLTLVVKPGAWLLRRQASADPRSNRLILRLPAAQHLLETAISVLRVASRRHCPRRW
jgi:hypothetical protein